MKRIATFILIVLVFAATASSQKKLGTWSEWAKKDAEKILNDSAWGKTQVDTDTSEMTYSPTPTTSSRSVDGSRTERGALNQEVYIKYRIRFLSAKPVRQAFVRMVELQQEQPNKQLSEQLRSFVERIFDDYIVVAVGFESSDQRLAGPVMQEINSAVAGVLKNTTYLERKDGKRLFLMDYRAPINDGMGAKFVFPRLVDGEPFITPDSGEVRFYSEIGKKVKINMRFKISEMMFEGRLEI